MDNTENEDKDGRGRPEFRKSRKLIEQVESRVAAGWTQEHISKELGIDVKTLTKHFRSELDFGASKQQGKTLDQLRSAAAKGNVAAMKKVLEIYEKGSLASLSAGLSDGNPEVVKSVLKKDKLGKKEMAQLAAASVDSKYAPPPPPKLVVNNK